MKRTTISVLAFVALAFLVSGEWTFSESSPATACDTLNRDLHDPIPPFCQITDENVPLGMIDEGADTTPEGRLPGFWDAVYHLIVSTDALLGVPFIL